ncbi:MAG: hypothetical protein AAF191_15390 [Verrucomicrobiota bacterium]
MTVGQSRDPWSRLSEYDKDQNGEITREEFGTGPAQIFQRFDQNEDGILTKEEVAAARGMGGKGKGGTKGKGRGEDHAPKAGDDAPAVKARKAGTEDFVDLANPTKISVLVFGSHT